MVLISSDIAADPFSHARPHAEAVLTWIAVPAPLPQRCPSRDMDSPGQSSDQSRSDVAKQPVSRTTVDMDLGLAAVRGVITRAQP